MVNFRGSLKRMLRGEETGEVRFRPGDFYQDIGNDFNQLKREMLSSESATGHQSESNSVNGESTEPSPIAPVVTSISPQTGQHV